MQPDTVVLGHPPIGKPPQLAPHAGRIAAISPQSVLTRRKAIVNEIARRRTFRVLPEPYLPSLEDDPILLPGVGARPGRPDPLGIVIPYPLNPDSALNRHGTAIAFEGGAACEPVAFVAVTTHAICLPPVSALTSVYELLVALAILVPFLVH